MGKSLKIQFGFYTNGGHMSAEKVKNGSDIASAYFKQIEELWKQRKELDEKGKPLWTQKILTIPNSTFNEIKESLLKVSKKDNGRHIIIFISHEPIGSLYQDDIYYWHYHNCNPEDKTKALSPEHRKSRKEVTELFCPACGMIKPIEEFKTMSA